MDVRNLKPIEGLRDPVPASGYNAILHAVQRLMETPPAAVMGRTGLPGLFRVDSSTRDGTKKRWVYTLIEVYKASTGYDEWDDLPQGRQVTAHNTAERDGVDAPVPNGTVVHAAPVMSGVNLEWWFTYVHPGSGFFRVHSSTQDGTNQRWVYTLVEVHKASAGYDGWDDLPHGRQVTARNTAERDGVDAPVPNGTVVHAAPVMSGVNLEWWFTYVRPGSGSGSPVRWGKVIDGGWSHGNSVRLTPCVGPLDDTPTGQSVDAYIVLPHGVSPRPLDLAEGAIVPFVTVGNVSVLLSVRVATLDLKNNGSTAVATTRQINIPAQSNSVLMFDGSDLKLRPSLSDGKVPIWDNHLGKWVIDWVWLA